MSILGDFLKKVGVNNYSELTIEEQRTYKEWESALSGRKLTDEDVNQFLAMEKSDAINKLSTTSLKTREDIFLKMKLDFLIHLEKFLASPFVEKQMTEAAIKQMLEK
jgi:hypothetical protein